MIKDTAIISIDEYENRKFQEVFNIPNSPPPSLTIYAESILKEFNISINSIGEYPLDDIIDNNNDIYSTENEMFQKFKDVKFGNDYYFNAEIFPIFQRIFDQIDVEKKEYSKLVFNSEAYKWLPEDDNYNRNYKPDGYICYSSFSENKEIPNYDGMNEEVRYGVPNKNCISFIHGVLEGKPESDSISLDDLGRLFKYLFLLMKQGHNNPRGVIYNQSELIFVSFDSVGRCNGIYKRLWSQPKCSECLVSFFSNSCSLVAEEIVKHFYTHQYKVHKVLGKGRHHLLL